MTRKEQFDEIEITGEARAAAVNTKGLDISGWNWIDVSNHSVPVHDIDTTTLQGVSARTDYPNYDSCVGPINTLFSEFGNNTVLVFPSGDYWVPYNEVIAPFDASLNTFVDKNLAIVFRSGARFVNEPFTERVPSNTAGDTGKFLVLRSGANDSPIENLVVSGVTVSFEAAECGRGIQAVGAGNSVLENLTLVGQHDSLDQGDRALTVGTPNPQDNLLIDGYRAVDGALWDDVNYDMGASTSINLRHQGILVPDDGSNRGTVILRDCELAGWTSHAIYASKMDGAMRIIRPRLRNNRGASIRVGSTATSVIDPKIVLDNRTGELDKYDSIRPIWIEGTGQTGGSERVRIENPHVTVYNTPMSILSSMLDINTDVRSAAVSGGYFYTDGPQRLCRLNDATVQNEGILLENLTVIRDAPPDSISLANIAPITLYREHVTVRNATVRCAVDGTTANRGVLLQANNCVIDGGTFIADSGGILTGGDENLIQGDVTIDSSGTGISYTSGSDNRLRDISLSAIQATGTAIESGTRTRWDGVIGGGPLGGIDLSRVHGQRARDVAVSDGTAVDFPKGSLATWRGTSWIRVDGQATVSPS